MGKLKIEDFKAWFGEIEREAHEKMVVEELRVWKSAEKNKDIQNKFRDKLKVLDINPDPEYGAGQKYEIRPNEENKKYHKGGWLYDFCLRELDIKIENSNKIITLKKMILAMEIEMTQNDGSIRNDFHKLLQADAEYKIMVFQRRQQDKGQNKGDVNDVFEMLKQQAKAYKPQSNSKYLLCGWSISRLQFEIEAFTVENGRINEIKIG
jgi:hypothetical protein